jgi:hypothetical protein
MKKQIKKIHDDIQNIILNINQLNHHLIDYNILEYSIDDFNQWNSNFKIHIDNLSAEVNKIVGLMKIEKNAEIRAKLLVSAKILDENGHYHSDFFREETVAKSKE